MRECETRAVVTQPARGRALRIAEAAGIAGAVLAGAALCVRIAPHAAAEPWLAAAAVLCGLAGADLVTGLAHFAADRFGSPRTPGLGPVIAAFREHHRDPLAITRHGFVETNGLNCMLSLPGLLGALLVPVAEGGAALFSGAGMGALAAATAATNQLHKWAHAPRPPAPVRALQRLRLALPPAHHARHHAPPHTTHYCVTNGWLNAPLARLGVFPALARALAGRRRVRLGRASDQVRGVRRRLAEPRPADLPVPVVATEVRHQLAQLLRRVDAQARHEAVEDHEQRHQRHHVGEEQPGEPARPHERHHQEHVQR
jgi:ubiquitin-conjugating enzyme E2 variant